MENSTVINLCGNYPENFEKADVLSDPIITEVSKDLIEESSKKINLASNKAIEEVYGQFDFSISTEERKSYINAINVTNLDI